MIEDVAERLATRSGYELVDFAEVGLPLYRLDVAVVSIGRRDLPTVAEFILRGVRSGIATVPLLSKFLGLPAHIVEMGLSVLLDKKCVRLANQELLALNERGIETLEKGHLGEPFDETVRADFDGITREILPPLLEPLFKPAELEAAGIKEIRPYPAAPPEIQDLDLPSFRDAVRRSRTQREHDHEILALNRLGRTRLFRSGICLVFRSTTSGDVQVAFAINGSLSEKHEQAFARRGGPKKMQIIESVSQFDVRQNLKSILGAEALKKLPSESQIEPMRIREAAARFKAKSAQAKLERVQGTPQAADALKNLREALKKLGDIEAENRNFVLRPVAVYEHLRLLSNALDSATQKIIITSPRILPTVVGPALRRKLDDLANQGIRVQLIAEHLPQRDNGRQYQELEEFLSKLIRQSRGGVHLAIQELGKINYLVVDEKWAVMSSFMWLAYKDAKRQFRHEHGLFIQDHAIVRDLIAKLAPAS